MATTTQTDFNPAAHGLRVAEPIRRKPRSPNSRATAKPKYADAVWFSFQHGEPLEVSVRPTAALDTVRQLKQAARYLERINSTGGKKTEVRVQTSIEPEMEPVIGEDGQVVLDDHGKPVLQPAVPARSLVKFLGHEPFLLGRRVSMEKAKLAEEAERPRSLDTDDTGRPDLRQVAHKTAAEVAGPGQHRRRTVSGTRGQHRKTALRPVWRPVVRAVITPHTPQFSPCGRTWGVWCFLYALPVNPGRV